MTERPDSFTIQELEQLSGFDRRTISYYVQQDLLPRVGKRGRGTVYPAAFCERLIFIRAVRDLQDAGELRAVSLAEIKALMHATSTEALIQLRNGPSSSKSIRSLFSDPDWDTHGLATPVESITGGSTKPPENSNCNQQCDVTLKDVKALVQKISVASGNQSSGNAEKDFRLVVKTNIQIAENVMITVNNLSEQHRKALIDLANALSS